MITHIILSLRTCTIAFITISFIFLSLPFCLAEKTPPRYLCGTIDNLALSETNKQLDKTYYPAPTTLDFFNIINQAIVEQIVLLKKCRRVLTQSGNSDQLPTYIKNWQSWVALIQLRNHIFEQLHSNDREKARGFGIKGIKQAKLELEAILCAFNHAHFEWIFGIQRFFKNVSITPIPLLILCLHILLLCVFYFIWCTKGIRSLKKIASRKNNNGLKKTSAIYLHARKPLELFILITYLKSSIEEIHTFLFITFLYKFVFWPLALWFIARILEGLILQEKAKDDLFFLRVKTIRWLLLILCFHLVINTLFAFILLDDGTLKHWLNILVTLIALPFACLIIYLWRHKIKTILNEDDEKNSPTAHWINKNDRGFMLLAGTCLGAGYLFFRWLIRSLFTLASKNPAIKAWLTYWFRVEVERQHADFQLKDPLIPINDKDSAPFTLNYPNATLIDGIYDHLLADIKNLTEESNASISLIHGALASGKTTFSIQLSQSLKKENPEYPFLYLDCPPGDFSSFMTTLTDAFDLTEEGKTREVVSLLKHAEPSMICIDNIQHLIRPCIHGLNELDRLIKLIRRSSMHIAWLLLIDTASWRFVERARGERFLFDLEKELPPWSEDCIYTLIKHRNTLANIEPDFIEMKLPRQLNETKKQPTEINLKRYVRILWEYSKGNPGQSLKLWNDSLYYPKSSRKSQATTAKRVIVRICTTDTKTALINLDLSLLFVLRAIVQLSKSSREAIGSSTNMSADEIIDALRHLMTQGLIEKDENNHYFVAWQWYPAILTLFRRKRLLDL